MSEFEFHAELFNCRTDALEALSDHGIEWLSDYDSIDLDHRLYGLEITGMKDAEVAVEVERIMRQLFPAWGVVRRFYWECIVTGWKVEISKRQDRPYEIIASH